MKQFLILCLCFLFLPSQAVLAQPPANNSNYWPVYRDDQTGFCISYPPAWLVVQPKGRNVRFSVNPPDGPGNCNVVARPNSKINGMSQTILNREVELLPQDPQSWAEYVGFPQTQIKVVESRITKIVDIPALMGVIEVKLENLEGKYTRKQIVALTFTPGVVWTLNCGASSFNEKEAKSRYDTLRPSFNKILGSFMFIK